MLPDSLVSTLAESLPELTVLKETERVVCSFCCIVSQVAVIAMLDLLT
jgi:hypothetical protein